MTGLNRSNRLIPRKSLRIGIVLGVLVTTCILGLAAHSAGAQVNDGVAPTFQSARTSADGNYVIITFSEDIDVIPWAKYVSSKRHDKLGWYMMWVMDVTVDGHRDPLFSGSISGNELSLRLRAPEVIRSGQEVKVAYNNIFATDAGGLFVDSDGNAVPFFDEQDVTNNSVYTHALNFVVGPPPGTDNLTISESTSSSGQSGSYTLTLASKPESNVIVDTEGTPYYAIETRPSVLTFTPDNWDMPQTVTVHTADDDDNSINEWAFARNAIRGVSVARSATSVLVLVDDIHDPLTVSGITSTSYDENGTTSVATYAVADTTVTWSLLGDDAGDFSISSAGALSFKRAPNFEKPADDNKDNVYEFFIQASDGTSTGYLTVTVTVNDVDESPVMIQLFDERGLGKAADRREVA